MTTTRTAISAARKAATAEFDRYLTATRCTATQYVPQCVIDAATAAYRDVGGRGEIDVVGHGNTTHPVCGVSVRKSATA